MCNTCLRNSRNIYFWHENLMETRSKTL